MMATNITQKDATLRELMDWLEGYRKNCERTLGSMLAKSDPALHGVAVGVGVLKGAVTAVRRVEWRFDAARSREQKRGREMNTDTDVRSWLKDIFGHDFGTEGFVMPQNAAGVWLVGPKALGPMWSETCLMNYTRLFLETFLNISLVSSITIHGIMKPIIIDGTKTGRVRKFEIVDGYHRLIAASVLGLKAPVCLIDMSTKGKKPSKRLVKDFLEAVYSKEDTK